jgi:hypothetical protein
VTESRLCDWGCLVKLKFVPRLAALLLAIWAISFPVAPTAHANQMCGPLGLVWGVVHEPMTCDEASAIEDELRSHPMQPQFFLDNGTLIRCQTNYSSGRWVICHDGPGWVSFQV